MSAPPSDPPAPASPETPAAAWLARRVAGLRADEEIAFQAWLRADSAHAREFAELEAAWQAVSFPDSPALAAATRQQVAARHQRRRQRRRRATLLGFSSLAAAAALVFALRPAPALSPQPTATTAATTIAPRPDRQTLPDGSTVELRHGAEIVVAFTPDLRRIELKRGEALFQVAKNPARPFVVTTERLAATAVGTAFTVAQLPGKAEVLVTEGRVQVEPLGASPSHEDVPAPRPLVVDAGYRAGLPADDRAGRELTLQKVTATELQQALAWREDRVEFTRTTLGDAVRLFNERNRLQLTIADEPTRAVRISGFFWLDDPEGFVRLLEAGFDLQAQRVDDRVFLRTP